MPQTPMQLQLLLLLSTVVQAWFPAGAGHRGWQAVPGERCKAPSVLHKASAAVIWTWHATAFCGNSCIFKKISVLPFF